MAKSKKKKEIDPVSPKLEEAAVESLDRSEDITSLIQAFEFFSETTEKLRESYDTLQEKMSELDLELEKKNSELYFNLREMDSVKNHLENILESMNMGVIVINLDSEVSIFNRAAAELTGYDPADVIGKPYSETIGNGMPTESTPEETLRTGIARRGKEKTFFTLEGKPIPVEYSTSMVSNEDGTILGAVELFSDLREIKRLQEEVQQARTLSALGEMASNVAHEIRNPLGGIGGFAALLERDLEVGDPRRNLVGKIIEGVSRLNRIATNLLIYTRPIRPKKRPEDIVVVVDDVLTLIEVELEQDESKINIIKKYDFDKLDVPIDPDMFQQVFLNIAKNAVQAMDDTGDLVIGLRDDKINERVEIYVTDQGVGIPKEQLKKLYLPFFTTKADGTGLGLSIVKKIIESHSGDIEVESEVSVGTTFKLYFPY